MMAFLALRAASTGDVVPMFLEDLQFDGADSRRDHVGRRDPRRRRRRRRHVVVIGCGESGILAGIRLAQAGPAVHDRREERRARRHVVGEPLPGRTRRRRQPLVLLLVRARRPLDRVLLPAARAARLLRRRRRQVRAATRTAGSAPTVTASTWDEATRPLARRRRRRRTAPTEVLDAPVRDQRRRFAEPAAAARHPRHGRLRRPVVPLGALARRPRHRGHAVRARSAPAPAASRSRRPSRTRSSSSRSSSAPRSGCSRTRCTTRRCPTGDRWAMRHLPFYGRWFRFLMIYPGHRDRHRAVPDRSRLRRRDGLVDQRGQRRPGASCSTAWIRVAARRTDPTCSRSRSPTTRRWASGCSRTTAPGCACLRKPNVELVRTGIERIVPDGVVTVDGTHPPGRRHLLRHRVPAQRLPRARWTSPGATASSLREQWGDEPTAYLGITVPELPEPVLPVRPGHEPRPRRAACSSTPSARSNYAMEAIHQVLAVGRAQRSRCARTCTTSTPSGTRREISQLVWAHPSIAAQPLQEPAGQGLHAVAVADRPVLGAHPPRRPGRPSPGLTAARRADSAAPDGACHVVSPRGVRRSPSWRCGTSPSPRSGASSGPSCRCGPARGRCHRRRPCP